MNKLVMYGLFLLVMLSLVQANSWITAGYDNFRSYTQPTYSVDNGLNYNTLVRTLSGRYDIEPLVYDIDNDGSNEMIIFEGTTIFIYDSALQIEAQRSVTVFGYNSIVSNPIIFNMNTSNSKLELGLIAHNNTDNSNDLLGFDVTGAIITRVFKIRNIKTPLSSEFRILVSDMKGLHNYYIKDKRYFRVYNDKTFICEVDLGTNDTRTGALTMPQDIDSYGTNWQGDFNGDGVIDIAFWHNQRIMVYDATCNKVIDFNANSYSSTVSNYQPIIFVNFDGGDQELVTTTNGGNYYSIQTNSYIIALNNLNTTIFAPLSHHCPALGGAPDANILNAIKMNINTNSGEYSGDEVVIGIECSSFCGTCGTDGMAFQYFNENGAKGLVKANAITLWSGTKSRFSKSSITGETTSNSIVFIQQISQSGATIASGSLLTNSTNHLKYTTINSSIKSFSGTLNIVLDDGIVLSDLDGDHKNDIIYTDSYNGKIIVDLSGEPVVATYNITIEVDDYHDNVGIDNVKVKLDGVTQYTNPSGLTTFTVTSLSGHTINITKDNYNSYYDISQSFLVSPIINNLYLSKLIEEPTVLEALYNVRWFDNFTRTEHISHTGWLSRQSNTFMNNDFVVKDWQSFGNSLIMNNSVAGLYINHLTYTTSLNNMFYFRLYVNNDEVFSNNFSNADYTLIQYGDRNRPSVNQINFQLRTWFNYSNGKYYIDYYDNSSHTFVNCLKLNSTYYVPIDYKIITNSKNFSVYVFQNTFGSDSYYLGTNPLDGWVQCIGNEPMQNVGLITEMSILSRPLSTGEIILDKVYSSDYGSVSGCTSMQNYITSIGFATGNPICLGAQQQYLININNPNNDYVSVRIDCYGNNSWSDWTYLAQVTQYGYPCTYNKTGTFNAKFLLTDLCSYPNSISNQTYLQTVSQSNCYTSGQGGSSTGITNLDTDIIGWKGNFTDNIDGYSSDYLDFSSCNGWQKGWRAVFLPFCPIWNIFTAILNTIFNWIFSPAFGIFLIILIIIIIIVAVRRKR